MEANNEQLSADTQAIINEVKDESRKAVLTKIKKWAGVIWHVPGIKNAALSLLVKLLIRVGLPAGAGALILNLLEAVGANL